MPSAVPSGFEYVLHLRTRARAQDNQVFAVGANLTSGAYCGKSLIVDPRGEVLAEAGTGEEMIYAELDLDLIERERAKEPALHLRRPKLYARYVVEMTNLPTPSGPHDGTARPPHTGTARPERSRRESHMGRFNVLMSRRPLFALLVLLAMPLAACQPPGGDVAVDESPQPGEPGPVDEESPQEETPDEVVTAPAEAPVEGEPLRIGIVTFLTGGAAEPFGIPARDAANQIVSSLNSGEGPEGYDTPGIGGRPIEVVFVDEAGGAETQVSEYRRLVLDEEVDLVIGYISSGDCEAIAPVAEELETLTVFFDCGTNTIFEENEDLRYVFRTSAHQIVDSVGAARYLSEQFPDATSAAGINQNYAWGQDSWEAFSTSLQQLMPDVELQEALFPELFAGEYSAELSSLLSRTPDIVHTSFWGGDLESFVVQAAPRGLMDQSTVVMTAADPLLPRLGEQLPPGVVVGARGPHGALAPDNALNDWLVEIYESFVGVRPVYPAYHMAQAILGVKSAYEAAADGGGEPTQDDVIDAFAGLEFETPSGTIRMALANGHQAVEPGVYGTTGSFDEEAGEVSIENIVEYPAECVNPPEGMTSAEWIESGFEGAEC